jgi:hypothetical protein
MDSLGRTGAAALAVLALAGLTGCHGTSSPAVVPGVPSVAATAPSSEPSPVDEPPARKPVGGRCPAAGLIPNLIFQRAHDGLVNAMLVLTNKTARCTLKRAVIFTVLDAARKPIAGRTLVRKFPDAGPLITLRPRDPVFSGVQWRAGPRCAPAAGLSLTVPGAAGRVNVGLTGFGDKATALARFRICGQITVGTLQPTSKGVNFP